MPMLPFAPSGCRQRLLPQRLSQFLPDGARERIGTAARSKRHDEAYWPFG